MKEIIFRLFFRKGKQVGTLKNTYTFIKYVPVVIVMSVSHVSGYAMIWIGKGNEIPHISKNRFAADLSVWRAGNIRL